MSNLELTMACGSYDRTIALQDGSVSPAGIDINFLSMRPGPMFRRQARSAEFDVAEFSFSTYCMLRSRGDIRMMAIPVFASRKFRHGHIFVNDSISEPSDLIGKRVGCHEYQNTASVWIRGIVKDEYGVAPEDVNWVLGGLNAAKSEGDRIPLEFGPGMHVERTPAGRYSSEMLESGDIDAIISAEIPDSFWRKGGVVRRLIPDYREVEMEYFRRTRIFPIMHLVVIKSEVYERHPWVAANLMQAFEEAKQVGQERLRYSGALFASLPWLGQHIEEVDAMTANQGLFPYGVEPNRHVLETFLGYSLDQGLIDRPMSVEDLFAPETAQL
jgi:4,5-dihydroxyphthalate decarboxylase